jgi:molybdopterin synthase catalytic subunit
MVTVRFFARLRDLAGRDSITLPIEGPVPMKRWIESLSSSVPPVASLLREKRLLVAVNEVLATEETVVRDGDEIALMPPFSGGGRLRETRPAGAAWARIQPEDFSADEEIARVKSVSTRVGGIALFLGTARDFSRGRPVDKLSYEHYAGMAGKKLSEIRLEAKRRFGIIEAVIVHRTGGIPVGGNIVLIVVGAEHRDEAFRACRWCIDELKATVPIWKRETTPEGEVWVEDRP